MSENPKQDTSRREFLKHTGQAPGATGRWADLDSIGLPMNRHRLLGLSATSTAVWLVASFLAFLTWPVSEVAGENASDPIVARSVVSVGDTSRLQRVLAKARRGESVKIAVIGGSITAGAGASARENHYGSLLAQWWRKTFPDARVELINAGIGATGSNYGALRAQRDLLVRRPDLVAVEFGVNDANDPACAETLEGVVRQVLKQPNQPGRSSR